MANFVIRNGHEWPQIIPLGGALPILQSGVFIGDAEKLNFVGAVVTVNGGDPTQIDVTIAAGGVTPGFGIDITLGVVSVDTSAVFTGVNAWTGAHAFNGGIDSNLTPIADNTYILGTTALRWSELHAGPGVGAGSVFVRNDTTNTDYVALGFFGSTTTFLSANTKTAFSAVGLDVVVLSGGGGPASVSAGGNGGVAELISGVGGAGTATLKGGTGGETVVEAGMGGTSGGDGGSVDLLSGAGRTGTATLAGGLAGRILLGARGGGNGTSTTISGSGGAIVINTGRAGVNGGFGAGVSATCIISGSMGRDAVGAGVTPHGTDGGLVQVRAQRGGNASGVGTAGIGGALLLNAGNGGNSSATAGGAGGITTLLAGNGGPGQIIAISPGRGGDLVCMAGNGGAFLGGGGADGGDAYFDAGLRGGGFDNPGLVYIGATNALSVNITRTLGRLGFFSAPAVVQQATTGGLAGFVANVSAAIVYNGSTWTGAVGASAYTITDIVFALKNYGLLAA